MNKILKCDNKRCGDHLCKNHDCNNEAEMIKGKYGNIHSALCTKCWKDKQENEFNIDWLNEEGCILNREEIEHYMINHAVTCHSCSFEFMAHPELKEHKLFEKELCKNCYKEEMGEDYK